MENTNTLYDDFMEIETLVSQLDTFTDTVDSEIERLDDWRMRNCNDENDGDGCRNLVNRLKYLSQIHHQELLRLQDMVEAIDDKVMSIVKAAKKSSSELGSANDRLIKAFTNL